MHELIRTNDPVLLSFVESLLREAGIDPLVLDRNMSVMEGSIGILPRRVLVADEDWSRARHVLQTSGVELDG
jgi:hypothetical protein